MINTIGLKVNGVVNKNTFDHPYYIKGKGWCSYSPEETELNYGWKVDAIKEGDLCLFINEGSIEYIKIEKISEEKRTVKTFNLSKVSKNKNFFANGILVHNKKL